MLERLTFALLLAAAALGCPSPTPIVVVPLGSAGVARSSSLARSPEPLLRSKEDDRDGDGLADEVDRCPDDPEDLDRFQDEDGCPDPDNDGDGVPDMADMCPNDAGPARNHGCPTGRAKK